MIRVQEYLEEKRPVGANQYTERVAQNEPPSTTAEAVGANQYTERVSQNETPTAEATASRYGVGHATIKRDAQFAQALDRVAEARQ